MSTPIDYRNLLLRYIDHVGECEGVSFLSDLHLNRLPSRSKFTDEEIAELRKLDKEADELSALRHEER